ncbi:hypothetical protein AURDEDRAFT_160125 [Auricularia subglabra TFB-10046 SS5]|nr:hypothetical protein AURDEDRAFT_160125 [Auricularia subglabra TFB-10046 SS5]
MRGRDCRFKHIPNVDAEALSTTLSTVPTTSRILDDLPPLPELPSLPSTSRPRFQFTPLPPLPVISLPSTARRLDVDLPPLPTFPPVRRIQDWTPLPPLPIINTVRSQVTSAKPRRVRRRARRTDSDDDDDRPPPMEWRPGQTESDDEDQGSGEDDEEDEDEDEEMDDEDDDDSDDEENEGGGDRRNYGSGGESDESLMANFGGIAYGPPVGETSAREPRYSGSQALVLRNDTNREWNPKRLRPGIKSLRFTEDFIWFETRHIRDIANADAAFGHGLEVIIVKHGWWQIVDADIALLAAACPNLVHLTIDGCRQLSDAAMRISSACIMRYNPPTFRGALICGNLRL